MKYAVMANLTFDTPAKRDGFFNSLKIKIDGKVTWDELINQSYTGEKNLPSHSVVIRFENRADMDEVFDFIKDRMEHVPVLKGRVSKHPCPHDEGGKPCISWEEYVKE